MSDDTKRILVVEDEDAIREFVVINLKRSGYEVVDAGSAEQALEIYDSSNKTFGVALIDVMMPGMDGFQLCKELRKRSGALGIIMLTARTQEMDKVNGLMIGADDYVTKPFSPSELVARVDAIYRRISVPRQEAEPQVESYTSGPFELSLRSRLVYKNGTAITLTQVEFLILEQFMQKPNVALGRQEILLAVWGKDYYGDIKIVDVNIRRLRMKLEDDSSIPKYILTVWGFGYKWNE